MARLAAPLRSTHKAFARLLTYKLAETPVFQHIKTSQSAFHGLYSYKAFEDLWFRQGEALTARLNAQIHDLGVDNTPADLSELIASTFNTPELAPITACAARLHNLQFCLESLRPHEAALPGGKPGAEALLRTPSIATRPDNEPAHAALREWIDDSFGSVAELRSLLLNSALAIKGDGVTWLVAQASYSASSLRGGSQADLSFSTLAVVNTYNAGVVDDAVRLGQLSKLRQQRLAREEAAARRQRERSEIAGAPRLPAEPSLDAVPAPEDPAASTVLGSVEEAEEATLYLDRKLVPLLAVDASMRAYLHDYGVFGKLQYLDSVWRCINWDVVAERAPARFKPSVVFDR
ncbi:hypothetical protein METBIDRAFT_45045 [Metschnikowia bicuspidata var. bicuspidata NRRL YB-4993]|uniref:Manganese/iron superoxide dismutase C-terminal domain-containing protein n=1 Tax=Metschnikowia bicuspidata var. bicuspidata NRRL YB-4993 TaxID=869754 RepID=A0A1A0H752_9ASCO|nr:hypothetical protein METBIDRAFT_45045 [Metschnikowia bicuspidata var. bicuspidata NRRL YB-4993]OBA19728.1 hypothetical protein METBIDRAFT_45045 [Metschnikowia bicuspidata var. bicuspidata NRRL YB-4993]